MGCCTSNETPYKAPNHETVLKEYAVSRADFVRKIEGRFNDHYKVDKLLGQGGSSTVYICTHKRTGLQRAVKKISRFQLPDRGLKMMEEVEILTNLDHPNILKIIEVIETSNEFFLVTELCTGGDLYDYAITNGLQSEERVAKIMTDLLLALNHCHKSGIVHRDLKPENLLFVDDSPDSMLKIIDFGISKKIHGDVSISNLAGTIYYIAPEVLKGNYNEKCDIWSMGVILYIVMCGRPPFIGKTDDDTLRMINKGKFQMKEEIWNSRSTEVKKFITKMLKINPKERPSAEDCLLDEWIVQSRTSEPPQSVYNSLENLTNFHVIHI